MIGGVGGIGRSLSQMLKQTSRLDVLALYDVAALNKRFSTPIKLNCFSNGETTNLSVKFAYYFCVYRSVSRTCEFLLTEFADADDAGEIEIE